MPLETDEAEIIGYLENMGIHEYCTESNSFLDNTNDTVPIIPFLDSFNASLINWFRADAEKIRFIYLEDAPFLDRRIHSLSKEYGIVRYFEYASETNWLSFAVSTVIWVVLTGISKKRKSVIASAFPFALISLSLNNSTGLWLSASLLTVYYLADRGIYFNRPAIWRKSARINLFPVVIPSIVIVSLLLAVSGPGGVIHCSAALLCSSALLLIQPLIRPYIRVLMNRKRLHPKFEPQPILGVPPRIRWNLALFAVCAGCICAAVLSGLFIFSGSIHKNRHQETGQLSFPAPSEYTGETGLDSEQYENFIRNKEESELPDLADFLLARWIVATSFWTRIQLPIVHPKPGDTAVRILYSRSSEGIIESNKEVISVFDAAFFRKAFAANESKLQTMLVSQQRFTGVVFKRFNR